MWPCSSVSRFHCLSPTSVRCQGQRQLTPATSPFPRPPPSHKACRSQHSSTLQWRARAIRETVPPHVDPGRPAARDITTAPNLTLTTLLFDRKRTPKKPRLETLHPNAGSRDLRLNLSTQIPLAASGFLYSVTFPSFSSQPPVFQSLHRPCLFRPLLPRKAACDWSRIQLRFRLFELMKTRRESVVGIMSLDAVDKVLGISLVSLATSVLGWEYVKLVRMGHWVLPCKGGMGASEVTSLRLRLCK